MSERWLPAVGFEGSYEVSDQGRVRSVDRMVGNGRGGHRLAVGQIINPFVQKRTGHLVANLSLPGGRRFNRRVHRLVLEAFVGPCPEGMEGCHFPDHDPTNNRLENLRWDTTKANAADKEIHGNTARGNRNGMSKLTDELVRKAREMRATGMTLEAIAPSVGVTASTIGRALRGEGWTHVKREEQTDGTN